MSKRMISGWKDGVRTAEQGEIAASNREEMAASGSGAGGGKWPSILPFHPFIGDILFLFVTKSRHFDSKEHRDLI